MIAMREQIFDVDWYGKGPYVMGYPKITACVISVIRNNQKYKISDGEAYWNSDQDDYDEEIGKRESLNRAYANLPDEYTEDFDNWLAKL